MVEYTLYHGSTNIICNPDFGIGNVHNDYGLAFYCTENLNLAREWAVSADRDGFANCYKLNTEGLTELYLGNGKYNILNWLAILLENRVFRINSDIAQEAYKYIIDEFGIDYKGYDLIRGYRADDSYFSFANAFINNGLSLDKLNKVMKLGKLGEQIAVKSEKAINALQFVEALPSDSLEYYPKKKLRDDNARMQYKKERENITQGIYVMDILREGWKRDDERIQRIIY